MRGDQAGQEIGSEFEGLELTSARKPCKGVRSTFVDNPTPDCLNLYGFLLLVVLADSAAICRRVCCMIEKVLIKVHSFIFQVIGQQSQHLVLRKGTSIEDQKACKRPAVGFMDRGNNVWGVA